MVEHGFFLCLHSLNQIYDYLFDSLTQLMTPKLKWSPSELRPYRKITDPIADRVVADIIENDKTEGINKLFSQLRENDDISEINFPKCVADYFEETSELPSFMDQEQVKIGQKVFAQFGPEISLCLMTKSLPEAYACANGAKVLYATGRLTEQSGTLAVFTRRLMETAQFVINVNDEGGLSPKGKGVVTAQKVRLIHAAIRYYLQQHNWPEKYYGMPINQEDMAGTLQSFSTLTLEGLDILKLDLSEEEKQGYYHSWRCIGHVMGVLPELNPVTYQEGYGLGTSILNHQIAPSKEGTELTQAVCNFMKDMMPGEIFDQAPEAIIRHMIGDDIAETLKLDSKLNLIEKMIPKLIGIIFDKLEEVGEEHETLEKIIERVKGYLLQHMLNHFNNDKKVKFYIPPSLRKNWKLE